MNECILIGANGQLGNDLANVFIHENFPFIPFYHNRDDGENFFDVTNHNDVKKAIEYYKPRIVINATAFNKVDECETNIRIAYDINTYAVRNLAKICKENNIILVHFSTDYVFDGRKKQPYNEEDKPNPINVYGDSKFLGEQCILESGLEKYFIIRTAALQGTKKSRSKGTNFIESILKNAEGSSKLKVVNDQIINPTYTLDLARKTFELIQIDKYGLYHIVNHGECSWYEFARNILELAKKNVELIPISYEEAKIKFNYKAMRPRYSVLDNYNLRKLSLDNLRTWNEALIAYFEEKWNTQK